MIKEPMEERKDIWTREGNRGLKRETTRVGWERKKKDGKGSVGGKAV